MPWSVEIFNPVTNTSCSLPQLPNVRSYHSQNGGLVCGSWGVDGANNCVKWSPAFGNWTKSHYLSMMRYGHVSWATDSGVYLMGDRDSAVTRTEKVKWDGSSEEGFGLKYETRLYSALLHSINI